MFLASVPNFSGITQHLIGPKDRYVGIDHLNYWTARGFASYLVRFGFEITETLTFGFNPLTLIRDWRNPERSSDCAQMAIEVKRDASVKETWIVHAHGIVEKLLNFASLGDTVAVAARLPD